MRKSIELLLPPITVIVQHLYHTYLDLSVLTSLAQNNNQGDIIRELQVSGLRHPGVEGVVNILVPVLRVYSI